MFFQNFVNFIFWLWGVLDVIAALGGLIALVVLCWLFFTRRGAAARASLHIDDEYRCRHCTECNYCAAAYSGVAYPCPDYQERKDKP